MSNILPSKDNQPISYSGSEEPQAVEKEESKAQFEASKVNRYLAENEEFKHFAPYVKQGVSLTLQLLGFNKDLSNIIGSGAGGAASTKVHAGQDQKSIFLKSLINESSKGIEQCNAQIENHVKDLLNTSDEETKTVEKVVENLKKICFEHVPAEEALPYNLLKSASKTIGSLFGYNIPEEFTREEHHEFCKNLDKLLNERKQRIEKTKETYKEQMGTLQEEIKGNIEPFKEKLAEASIEPDLLPEVLKEGARGSINAAITVLGDIALNQKLKGPIFFLIGTLGLSAFKQTSDMVMKEVMETQSTTNILDASLEKGQLLIEKNLSVEFMAGLVNSLGVANVALLTSILLPGVGTLTIAAISIAAGQLFGKLNPTTSTEKELESKGKGIGSKLNEAIRQEKDINAFISKFADELEESDLEELYKIIKNSISNENIRTDLIQALQKSSLTEKGSIQENQATENLESNQNIEESESQQSEEKRMQQLVTLSIFATITLYLLKSIKPSIEEARKSSQTKEEDSIKKNKETSTETTEKMEAPLNPSAKITHPPIIHPPIQPIIDPQIAAFSSAILVLLTYANKEAEQKKALDSRVLSFQFTANNIIDSVTNQRINPKEARNELDKLFNDSFTPNERNQIQSKIQPLFNELELLGSVTMEESIEQSHRDFVDFRKKTKVSKTNISPDPINKLLPPKTFTLPFTTVSNRNLGAARITSLEKPRELKRAQLPPTIKKFR